MEELDKLREQIDAIDGEMISLYERRLGLVEEVADYKKRSGMPILQNNREEEVLDGATSALRDKKYEAPTRQFMRCVMDISRGVQSRKNCAPMPQYEYKPFEKDAPVGYFGLEGSNSESAAIEFFERDGGKSFASFGAVFKALARGEITYGVVPIENSSTGAISEVYDLLKKFDFYIVGEQWTRIEHMLIGCRGASEESVRDVYSHIQALEQCEEYISRNAFKTHASASTSDAARLVAESRDKSVAAIACERAAKKYGLEILAKAINDQRDNFTRFIIVARALTDVQSGKVSVLFSTQNRAGALYRVLGAFCENCISMDKIESRPIANNPGSYCFYVDLEGDFESPQMRAALESARCDCNYFKLLGKYAKGEIS